MNRARFLLYGTACGGEINCMQGDFPAALLHAINIMHDDSLNVRQLHHVHECERVS